MGVGSEGVGVGFGMDMYVMGDRSGDDGCDCI